MTELVAFYSLFVTGMYISMLGAVSVKLMPRLHINAKRFGTMVAMLLAVSLVAVLLSGPALDSFGYRVMALFGFALCGSAIVALGLARSYTAAVLACACMGTGAMALSVVANTLFPVVFFGGNNPVAASNLGNVAFGVGFLVNPLVVSTLFQRTSYEKAIGAVGVLVLLGILPALLAAYPAHESTFNAGTIPGLLQERVVLLAAGLCFCYGCMESAVTNWLPPLAKETLAKTRENTDDARTDATAQRLLAFVALSIIVGRLVCTMIPNGALVGPWIIAGGAVLVAVATVALACSKSRWAFRASSILVGFGLAPIFGTILGVAFTSFAPDVYGSIFAVVSTCGFFGGVITPKIIGNIAQRHSINRGFLVLLPVSMLAIVFCILFLSIFPL